MSDTASSLRSLSVIGCGKLGQTLAHLWATQGVFRIDQILNRSSASAERARNFIGTGVPLASFAQLQASDVYLLAPPDDQISAIANQLAASASLGPGVVVFHCSGALPSSILQALRDKGASIASVHPIKSFASPPQASTSFAGTWCGMEGDPAALEVLAVAFQAIGGNTVVVSTEDKLIYHAAAVFASNYLVTLLDAALQAYIKAGIPEQTAREMLIPLVKGTLENVVRDGADKALTGPIARGDYTTVAAQYQALKTWNRQNASLYKLLSLHTARLSKRRR